jgi:NitT/TauT family transport system substrate-binding protein
MRAHSRLQSHVCLVATLLLSLALAGCARNPDKPSAAKIRVAYFPNLTHSQALIGISRGDFAKALGPSVTIDAKLFNAGPSVIEALFAGQIDLAYIGPNPAITGYVRSKGAALRVVAGATSGGAGLVVRPQAGIRSAADLSGKRIASPQLGNTQDVALRAYVAANGLRMTEKGGTVQVIPIDNPSILDLFRRGDIDGAWVPEPWTSRLIVDGGGTLFLDERSLWPNGDFATAIVIVSKPYLDAHPDLVKAWLQVHVALTLWEVSHPEEAKSLANEQIQVATGKALTAAVLEGAWSRERVTYDPIGSSITQSAKAAFAAGFLDQEPDLSGLLDLTLLNQVLAGQGLPAVH